LWPGVSTTSLRETEEEATDHQLHLNHNINLIHHLVLQ